MTGQSRRAWPFWIVFLVVLCVTSIAAGRAAVAHDHVAPQVVLKAGDVKQEGTPREVWWTRKTSDGGCVGSNATGTGEFPDAVEVEMGGRAAFTFRKSQQPRGVSITMWSGATIGDESVMGEPDDIPFELRSFRIHGKRVWKAVFYRPEVGEHFFEVSARWRDDEGCGGGQGGFWRFHMVVMP